ncbi:hypothetical protein C8R44DRAFT_884140 [Mycena epipterygia]|nr:hypothetical protein C8R44DRAFT_884140 [Mycena epipterygia]
MNRVETTDDVSASDSGSFSGDSEPQFTPPPDPVVALSPELTRLDRTCPSSTERHHHPYDHAKENKDSKEKPPRKAWNHALEKPLFNFLELTTLGAPQRRPIYIASLEAHIDRLHTQLLSLGPDLYPVDLKELDALKGLNAKICKGLLAGFHYDISLAQGRLLELQRSNEKLETALYAPRSV